MRPPPLPPDEAERLKELKSLGALDTPPESLLDELTTLAADLCKAPMAVLSLVDEDRQWFKSRVGIEVCETNRAVSFCGHAILSDTVMVVEDTQEDPRFEGNPLMTESPHIRFYAGAPLRRSSGSHLGTLCVMDTQPRQLDGGQQNALMVLARHITRLLQLRKSDQDLQTTRGLLRSAIQATEAQHQIVSELRKVQDQFIYTPSTSKAFDMTLSLLLRMTESEYGFIGEVLRDPEGQPFLKTHAITNIAWNDETRTFYEENAPAGMEFRNLKTLFGQVLVTEEPVFSNRPDGDSRRGGIPSGHPALNAFLGVPINLGGTMVGMVGLANRPGGYAEEILTEIGPILTTYGNLIQARRNRVERERAEERLKENEARLQRVIDASGLGYWDWDMETGHTVFSGQWAAMLGYAPDELEPTAGTWLELIHPEDKAAAMRAVEEHREGRSESYSLEHRLRTKDGDWRWILAEGRIVSRDAEGAPRRMSGIHKDIHDRKMVEVQARELQQNKLLMQEVHHRVKNNLQIVSSLLSFQQRRATDPDTAGEFELTRNRVATISLLHELLYRSSRLDRLGVDQLVRELLEQIEQAYGVDGSRIVVSHTVEPVLLHFDQAGPCALILNELITNALKHAFPGSRSGHIRVHGALETGASASSRLVLTISDDGVGLPDPPSSRARGASIGMVLVRRLSDQLGGTFDACPAETGTTWKLSFEVTE